MSSAGPATGSPAWVLVKALRAYQLAVSPLLGPRCRFLPSCSAYAVEAVSRWGALRGSWLAVRRLARCHPLHPGGYDPVPSQPERGLPPSTRRRQQQGATRC